MKKINLLLLATLLFYNLRTLAQSEGCLSNFKSDSVAQYHPSQYSQFQLYEQHVSNYLQSMSNSQHQRLISANSTIIIPVVVHVLYNNPSQNITDAVINSQIQVIRQHPSY